MKASPSLRRLVVLSMPLQSSAWLLGKHRIQLQPAQFMPKSTTTQIASSFSVDTPPSQFEDEGRRDFLMQLGALAATALVGGGGAWTLQNHQQQDTPVTKTTDETTTVTKPTIVPVETATVTTSGARAVSETQWISTQEFSTLLTASAGPTEIDRVQFSGMPDTLGVRIVFRNGSHWRINDVNTQESYAQGIARLCSQYNIAHNFNELEEQWEQRQEDDQFALDNLAAAAVALF